jgi:DNA-directed RNA polymerase specialized sigma24 family protein
MLVVRDSLEGYLPSCEPLKARNICAGEIRVAEEKQDLLQLYRFCFLMLADTVKAQEIFHAILREAAQLAADGEAPRDRLWFFRNARWRCLEAGEQGLQAEEVDFGQDELAELAPSQIQKLEPAQFAIWIAAAPDPQRTALALFYLNEFSYRDLLSVTELKPPELSKLLGNGRREFQAWLDSTSPVSQV